MLNPIQNTAPPRAGRGQSYLILALQGLGDALEATPLLAALREAHPAAEIDVAVTRSTVAELFEGLPAFVRRVVHLPFWEAGTVAFARALALESLRARYDVSLTSYPAAKLPYHITTRAFRATRRIGHAYPSALRVAFAAPYTDVVAVRDAHNIERNLDLLGALDIAPPNSPRYLVPDDWLAREIDRRMVTIHVGTTTHDGFSRKRWPIESFAQLARALMADGCTVTTLEGPEDFEDVARLVSLAPEIAVVRGPLREVSRHLSKSALVIANDSGIGHLAAGLGVRTLTLLGPTVPNGAPFGALATALRPSPCPPCFDPSDRRLVCKRGIDFRCLGSDFPVEAALEAARTELAESQLT